MSTIGNAVRVRTPWHETGRGCWSLSLELGGVTVRVTQRRAGTTFERIIVLGDGVQDWRSLDTTDRMLAERRAKEFLQMLIASRDAAPVWDEEATPPQASASPTPAERHAAPTQAPQQDQDSQLGRPPLPLGRLWTLYEESEAFAKLESKTQGDYRSSARSLVASMGAEMDVARLDKEAVNAHKRRRYAGGITYRRVKRNRLGNVMKDASSADIMVDVVTKPARDRTVGLDLQLLRIMLYWAVETRGPSGRHLLDEFPIRGSLDIPREQNPIRPFADYERFCTLLQAVQAAASAAEAEGDRRRARRYRLLELALVLVEACGRRISAVLELRRSDLVLNEAHGFVGAKIRWRPEGDKKNKEWWVPLPRELAALLAMLLKPLGVVGDAYVFAQVRSPDKAVSKDELSQWALEIERAAQLPHLKGGLWHPYRRKWAKERKHMPLKDVMAAGGWQDVKTFMDSYNEPDFDTMLDVMNAPARARAEAAATTAGEAVRTASGDPARRTVTSAANPSGVRRRPANQGEPRPQHIRLL